MCDNLLIHLSFWGFAELLESVGWGISSILEDIWRFLFQILLLPPSQSLLSWDSSGSYPTAFDWFPVSLMPWSVLSILFLSVLQSGSFLLTSVILLFRSLNIHDAIVLRLVQIPENFLLSFCLVDFSHHLDFTSSGMSSLFPRQGQIPSYTSQSTTCLSFWLIKVVILLTFYCTVELSVCLLL